MLQQAFRDQKFLNLGRSALYQQTVKLHTQKEMEKDLFGRGDLTVALLGKTQNKTIRASIKAKSTGVLAGMSELIWFLQKNNLRILKHQTDGTAIKSGEIILQIEGKAKNILVTERVGLNLIQRMSGIATLTQANVNKIPKQVLLASTRKTLWGLLDKKAVVVGGGGAHRLGLWHAILIKENHLKLATAQTLLENAWHFEKKGAFVEIETESHSEAIATAKIIKTLLAKKPLSIPLILMLDNFTPAEIEATAGEIKKIEPRIFIEISGGIQPNNLENFGKLANIDIISCGFLTHSANFLDFSLKID